MTSQKTLFYFYFNTCKACVEFVENTETGWKPFYDYLLEKGYKVVKKDLLKEDMTEMEESYLDENLDTVPHISIYNRDNHSWTKYEGSLDLEQLKKFVD